MFVHFFWYFLTKLIVYKINPSIFTSCLLTRHIINNNNNNNCVLMWPHLHYNCGLWHNYAQKYYFYDFGLNYNPIPGSWFVCTHLFSFVFFFFLTSTITLVLLKFSDCEIFPHAHIVVRCKVLDSYLHVCQYWSKPTQSYHVSSNNHTI